eukprot:17719-Rhodomonas_salina.1
MDSMDMVDQFDGAGRSGERAPKRARPLTQAGANAAGGSSSRQSSPEMATPGEAHAFGGVDTSLETPNEPASSQSPVGWARTSSTASAQPATPVMEDGGEPFAGMLSSVELPATRPPVDAGLACDAGGDIDTVETKFASAEEDAARML